MVNRRCAAVGEKARSEKKEEAVGGVKNGTAATLRLADDAREREAIVSPSGLSVFEQDARSHFRTIDCTLLSPSSVQSFHGHSGLAYIEVASRRVKRGMTSDEIAAGAISRNK